MSVRVAEISKVGGARLPVDSNFPELSQRSLERSALVASGSLGGKRVILAIFGAKTAVVWLP